MRRYNSSLRPNEAGCSPSYRKGKMHRPHRLGREWDAPPGIGMESRNPSMRPNEMSELLPAPEGNGTLLIASVGNGTTPHRLGRKWDAPEGLGETCRNPTLRPKEMSEPLTASQ
jgi:hypothetical protein